MGASHRLRDWWVAPTLLRKDFHATLLHLLGFNHEKLSYSFQGLNQRLTGVNPARVIEEVLASTWFTRYTAFVPVVSG